MNPLDRLSEYLGAIERRLRLIALTRGIAVTAGMALGAHRRGGAGHQPVRLLQWERDRRAGLPVPWPGVCHRGGAHHTRNPPQPPQCRAAGRSAASAVRRAPAHLHRAHRKQPRRSLPLPPGRRHAARSPAGRTQNHRQERLDLQLLLRRRGGRADTDLARHHPWLHGLWHIAPVGGTAQRRHQAVLFHPGGSGQPHRPQAQRPLDHRASHRLHRAQGAVLRQVRQRLPMGAGRNGHRAGWHRLPVHDRRRAGEPRILCRGRRREEQHLQAQRDRTARRQEDSRHLPLPVLAGPEG